MYPQIAMIERLRDVCLRDRRLVAGMLYGSFAHQEADHFSDIDCALFFEDDHLSRIDQRAWVEQVAPVDLYYRNEFGNGVAVFANLVRGEFHFDPASAMHIVETWRNAASFPSVEAALLVDRTGQLRSHLRKLLDPPPDRDTPDTVEFLFQSFLNWILFGSNLLARGELARALELLQLIGDYLLRMARLTEGCTRHWITPTKALESELSTEAYAQFVACTATANRAPLQSAYAAAWRWGSQLMRTLAKVHRLELPTALIEKIERHMAQYALQQRSTVD